MKLLTWVFFLGITFVSVSQDWKEISRDAFQDMLRKCSEQNRLENYFFTFTSEVYANPADATPISSSRGKLFHGKGVEYRLETSNQLLIQTSEVKMIIDSLEKTVFLMKPDTLFDQVNLDLLFASDDFRSASCLYRSEGNFHQYRILFPTGAYEMVEIWMDRSTSRIRRIAFYLTTSNYLSGQLEDETQERPYVVMEYFQPETFKATSGYFKLDPWLEKKGGTYHLRFDHSFFVLEDLRFTSTY